MIQERRWKGGGRVRVILLDPDSRALSAMADHIRERDPQAEVYAFPSQEALDRWARSPREVRLRVQTFGNFEVFCDGQPVHFHRRRTKELFAYLIDRRGAGCTMGQLISVLWEGRPDTESVRSQLRSLITDLRTTLRTLREEAAIIKQRDLIAVDPARVDCDYYRFLAGDPGAVSAFRGEYMTNYSWGETTLGALQQKK